jgi:hypothetical protein
VSEFETSRVRRIHFWESGGIRDFSGGAESQKLVLQGAARRIQRGCILLETASMRTAWCCVMVSLLLASPAVADPIAPPTVQVNGANSGSFTLNQDNFPILDFVFTPATLTVGQVALPGNVGLQAGDTLQFAGFTATIDMTTYAGQDLPFVHSGLLTFTTSAGSFSYDSTVANITDSSVLPDPSITDGTGVIFARGVLYGPGGSSSPADAAFFLSDTEGVFASAAWALYAPAVIPPSPIPEPSTGVLAGLSLATFALVRRYRAPRGR